MKNVTTYLFVMLMAMFWIFRIIVAFCYNLGVDFITEPIDCHKQKYACRINITCRKWIIFWILYI